MPRPGPRPYECIRRAWHSESHQALRGSLTQEIFRIVTEIHTAETRCKKEWQEKLPIVVLRAEEILYSKARTEADYADVSTLKSRLEDAVNTMIRRTDDSREKEEEESCTRPFMEPCVEAALSLGCIPRMNPRGQRSCPARTNNIIHNNNNTNNNNSVRRISASSSSNPTSIPSSTAMNAAQQNQTMRPNVPPCFNTNLQQQAAVSFMLRDQNPPTPPSAEDYSYQHLPGNVFANNNSNNNRFQHHPSTIFSSMFTPSMDSSRINPSHRRNESDHDLELSLGPPKISRSPGSVGVYEMGGSSSSSSGSSMSWQSEGVHHQRSKRKDFVCTQQFSGSGAGNPHEVTKRHRDFPKDLYM